jgi:hypothetical protein
MGLSLSSVFKSVVVVAAVATGFGALGAAGYLGAGVQATVLAAGGAVAFGVSAALMTGLTATVSQLLAETPKSFDLSEQIRGQLLTIKAPAADAKIVYGTTRVGGTILYVATSGEKNRFLHQVISIAGHRISAVGQVYLNDETGTRTFTDGRYLFTAAPDTAKQIKRIIKVQNETDSVRTFNFDFRLGTENQDPYSVLLEDTTAVNFQFKGIATLCFRIRYSTDVWPQGIPNVTVVVNGKRVYDPRNRQTYFTSNSALVIRDYLLDTTYGLGATEDEIDNDSFVAAANICDNLIGRSDGGTERRYTINGVFSSAEKPKDVLSKMLTSCGGKLAYVGGKWTLRVAAYRSPTVTLTEDDIIGPVNMQASQSRRDIFNAVKGTYSEPGNLYQPSSFPPIKNATYAQQDGETIWKDVQFPFTTSGATCQRLAKIDLETARQQISLSASFKLTAFSLQPGDTVNINFERYGWTNKVFEVYNWTFNIADSDSGPTPVVDLVLRETSSAIYNWNSGEDTRIDIAPNTNLTDPFDVETPTISISDELAIISEEVLTKLVVIVSGDSTFQDRFEVEVRKLGVIEYTNLGQASGNRFEFPNVEDGATYQVRARAINTLGVGSDYVFGTHQVVGKTLPPSDVTDFSMNIVGSEAHFTWAAVPDLDLSHYKIRHSRETSGATYANAVDLISKIARPAVSAVAPAMTGTYFIKAIDKLGNASVNETAIVAIIEEIKGLNIVETITESPTFVGVKTECNVTPEGLLILDTAIDFDDVSGFFDDLDGDFDGGGGTTSTLGTYEFSNVVDLGSVYTSRVSAFVQTGRIDYVNTFDDAVGLFDDRLGEFDGSPNSFDDTNVELQVSVTDGDPAGTPTWSEYRKFFVGDYKARAFRFKAILTSQDAQATPTISVLQVSVDMPDRVTSGDDISSGTDAGGKVVNFSPAFKATPALGIAAQNLASGDYYEIVSKTNSAFTIRFKNSGGTVVDRTFDYVARGYGELAA